MGKRTDRIIERRARPGPMVMKRLAEREREIHQWDDFKPAKPKTRRGARKRLADDLREAEELGIVIRLD